MAGCHERELEQQLREQQEAAASEQLKVLALHSQRLQLNAELGAREQEVHELRNQAEAAQQGFQELLGTREQEVHELRNQAEAAQQGVHELQARCGFDHQSMERLQVQVQQLQNIGAQLASELQEKQALQEAHSRLCDQNEQLASELQAARSTAELQAAESAARLQDLQSQLEIVRMREDEQVTGLMSELRAAKAEVQALKTKLSARAGRSPRSPRSPAPRPASDVQSEPSAAALASIKASDSQQPRVSVVVRTLEMGTAAPCKKCMQHAATDQDMNQRLEFILADRERLLSDRAAAEAQLQAAEHALELQQVRHAEAFDQVNTIPSC